MHITFWLLLLGVLCPSSAAKLGVLGGLLARNDTYSGVRRDSGVRRVSSDEPGSTFTADSTDAITVESGNSTDGDSGSSVLGSTDGSSAGDSSSIGGINLSSASKGSSSISGPAPAERTASSSSSTSTSGGSNVDSVNLGQNINVGLSGAGGGGSRPVLTQSFGGSQNVLNLAQIVDQLTITITQTTTIDRFVTVTDTILNSVPITLTGFKVNTVTLTTVGVRQTDVDDLIQIATTVVERPVTEVVTTAKSNFVYVTVVSSDLYTITHNAYLISQTTHTTVVTETITMASPVIRTTILTSVQISTEIHTVVNTIYVPGYNY